MWQLETPLSFDVKAVETTRFGEDVIACISAMHTLCQAGCQFESESGRG